MVGLFKVIEASDPERMQRRDESGNLVEMDTLQNGETAVRRRLVLERPSRIFYSQGNKHVEYDRIKAEVTGRLADEWDVMNGEYIAADIQFTMSTSGFQNCKVALYERV